MTKPFLRKKSKRQSTKLRAKIDKKVRGHNKKVKKQAKKGTLKNKKGKGKDPGIPHILPFRDEVLKEVEEAKQRRDDERQKKKEERKERKEQFLNEKRNLAGYMEDAQARQDAYDKIHGGGVDITEAPLKSLTDNPENSRKTFFKEFGKVVDAADVVLEVLDARDPLGSRCLEVEEKVRMSAGNKRLVLVINKIDLVPKDNVEAWLKHLRKEYPAVAFKASTQQQKTNLHRSKVSYLHASKDLLKSSNCLGADVLMKLLGNYCRNMEMSINVGVVGFPNTGKSSIINSLKRAKACNVGANPGVTKTMQTVILDKHVKLLDSPGVVMTNSPSETAAVLRNVVKLESLSDPIPGVEAILSRCQKHQMMMHYKIPDYHSTTEFLSYLAARLGKLRKGGVPDITRTGRKLLQDWNSGLITYYTSPPEDRSKDSHIEASIVTEWGKEFNIDQIIEEEHHSILKDLKPVSDKHFLVAPVDPLTGVTSADNDNGGMENGDDDDDDEFEDMEDDDDDDEHEELKGVTVSMDVSDKKAGLQVKQDLKDLSYRHKAPKAAKMEKVGGLIMRKSIKDQMRKEKKKKKKAANLAGKLSDAMSTAFTAFSGMGVDNSGGAGGDSYNFGSDFK